MSEHGRVVVLERSYADLRAECEKLRARVDDQAEHQSCRSPRKNRRRPSHHFTSWWRSSGRTASPVNQQWTAPTGPSDRHSKTDPNEPASLPDEGADSTLILGESRAAGIPGAENQLLPGPQHRPGSKESGFHPGEETTFCIRSHILQRSGSRLTGPNASSSHRRIQFNSVLFI